MQYFRKYGKKNIIIENEEIGNTRQKKNDEKPNSNCKISTNKIHDSPIFSLRSLRNIFAFFAVEKIVSYQFSEKGRGSFFRAGCREDFQFVVFRLFCF